MPLMKLQFQPGLNREVTAYSDEGGWWDADKVRFRMGYPEKIGGWQQFNSAALLGTCRAIHPWVALDGNEYLGFGTNLKYYVYGNGQYNDITPLRLPNATLTNPFTTVSAGSGIVTVTDVAHGCFPGDFVTFSGATAVSGITPAQLNKEHQVLTTPTGDTYTINTGGSAAAGGVTGGGTVTAAYQINTGLDTSIIGSGWGAGVWGGIGTGGTSSPPTTTGWGDPASTTVPGAQLRLWGHDNYGENLLFNVRNGGIYYWAKSVAFPRAVELSSLAGATAGKTPTIAKQVMVSDNDRHVLAFGCDDEFSIGTQDPLLIRFSDAENLTDWQSLPTNSAGSIRIGSGSAIVTAVETKQQIIVITDTSVHALQYLGPPFTFGLTMVSDNISITSPNAAIAVDDAVYWMGEGDFYVYNGTVTQIPCEVKDYVFLRIDPSQTQKVVAGANINFGEVWWFYQSAARPEDDYYPTDNDSYVVYNYQQRIWYFGTMSRSAWTHKNLGIYPIAASPADSYIYQHEFGTDDGSQNPPVGITAYIESTGQDLGDGDSFAFIWRMIPDITFRNSATVNPQATFTVMMSNFPGANFSQTNNNVVTKTSSYPVEQFTHQVFTRLRGRSFTFKISSDEVGTTWRLGAPRLDVRTDGRR